MSLRRVNPTRRTTKKGAAMLKRCQILLTDWLIEYAKFFSEKYDISLSESVRVIMCIGIGESVKELYPQYKQNITVKKVVDDLKKIKNNKLRQETLHKCISLAYHEARKAMEFRFAKEKINLSREK